MKNKLITFATEKLIGPVINPEIYQDQYKNGNGTIVAVDDDFEQQKILEACFRRSGNTHSLKFFSNGHDFVSWIELNTTKNDIPSLVLLDINMPGMDGFQVLKEVRKNNKLTSLPIIFMLTTSSFKDDIDKCIQNGANAYWSKPDSIAEYIEFFKKLTF